MAVVNPVYSSGSDDSGLIGVITRENTSINVPAGVEKIGDYALYNYTNLETLNLPQSIISIGSNACYGSGLLDTLVIPSGTRTVGDLAFGNCNGLTKVIFEGTPISLSTTAFESCPNITEIYVHWYSEDDVAGSPWGANNATIYFNQG